MNENDIKQKLKEMIKDGTFTNEDLMLLGLTREQANEIIQKLEQAGAIRLMPLGCSEN